MVYGEEKIVDLLENIYDVNIHNTPTKSKINISLKRNAPNGNIEDAHGGLNYNYHEHFNGIAFYWQGFNQTAERFYDVFKNIILDVCDGEKISFRKLEHCSVRRLYHADILFPDDYYLSEQQKEEIAVVVNRWYVAAMNN